MSFTVEFDGLLNENTDVVQVTASSSLNKSVPITVRQPTSGSYYDMDINNDNRTYGWWYSNQADDLYIYWANVLVSTGGTFYSTSKYVAPYTYYRSTIVVDGDGTYGSTWRLYRTYPSSSNTPVTITESIDQNGVVLSGGFLGSTSVVETQKGQASDSGVAVEFGIKVKENGVELVKTSHYPPAVSGEESKMSSSNSKVITATSTDLTVEAFGLGNGQDLKPSDTKVIVEEVE